MGGRALATHHVSFARVLGTLGPFPILRGVLARPSRIPTFLVLLALALGVVPCIALAQGEAPSSPGLGLERGALRLRYGLSVRAGEQVDTGPGLTYSGLTANDLGLGASFYAPGLQWLGGQLTLQREAFTLNREANRVTEGSLLRFSLGAVARRQLGPIRGELSLGYGFAQLPAFEGASTPTPVFQSGSRHAALLGGRVRFPIVQQVQGEVRAEFPLALAAQVPAGGGASSSGFAAGAAVRVPVKQQGRWAGAVLLDYQFVHDQLKADSGASSGQTLQRLGAVLELSWNDAELSSAGGSMQPSGPPGSLSLQVLDAETKAPLAGAQVTLVVEGAARQPLTADAKGQVVAQVSAEGYEPAEGRVTVAPGQRASLKVPARKQPPAVGGLKIIVVDKRDNHPLADAPVVVGGKEMKTDAAGEVRVGNLPVGPVLVKVSAPEFQSVEEAAVVVPGTESEMSVPLLPVKRLGYATISGKIRSTRQGRAIGATLAIPSANLRKRTDYQGSFSLKLKPGTYRIIISAKDHLTQTKSVTVRDGEQAIFNVDLFPRGR